jgi:peroxiredoxin
MDATMQHSPAASAPARVGPVLALLVATLVGAAGLASPRDALAAEPNVVGAAAPDFALRSLAGPNMRLSEHRGDVVVLSFWSSRCNVCRSQLAELDGLYATYRPAGFVVFGVNVDDDPAAAREFAAAQKLQFPMLFDPAKSVARSYRVDALPLLVAIDRFGAVRFVSRNDKPTAAADYVPALRKLIDE